MNLPHFFENEEFGTLRTMKDENGRTLFCGNDVATALGYAKPQNAVKSHCKGAALKQGIIDSMGRPQEMAFITEGDVYRLIIKSKLPSAEKFERWVFEDILPQVMRYGTGTPKLVALADDPDALIELASNLAPLDGDANETDELMELALKLKEANAEKLEWEQKYRDMLRKAMDCAVTEHGVEAEKYLFDDNCHVSTVVKKVGKNRIQFINTVKLY